jgi:D-sedoheptulose 7-phosphate isomerase
MQSLVSRYFNVLGKLPLATSVTDKGGKAVDLQAAYDQLTALVRKTHNQGNKLMFIGNGGSAGISSHMAIDYSKNGGIRSTAFNDPAALTCLSNDLGYENVFAKQIDLHARTGDMLIAISSSGQSASILKAVDVARERGCYVLTLSGFKASNPLRAVGDINFFVDSGEYGFVEISHLALCHAILDLEMGWGKKGITAEEKKLDAGIVAA